MKTVKKEVFWRKKNPDGPGKIRESLGECEAPHYETVEEAIDGLGGAETLLTRLNAQILTDRMNEYRAAKRPGGSVGKTALRNKAVERCTSEEMNAAIAQGNAQGLTPLAAIERLIESKMEEIKVELGINDDDED